jgi:hypothetical protein
LQYYQNSKNGKRKSIPYKDMNSIFKINRETNGILNYLPILNNYVKWKKTQNWTGPCIILNNSKTWEENVVNKNRPQWFSNGKKPKINFGLYIIHLQVLQIDQYLIFLL